MKSAWRDTLAREAYSLALRISLPFWFIKFWWRGRHEPLYRAFWGQRLGRFSGSLATGRLWLHAVSLGETHAAAVLIAEMRTQRPGLRLLLTHGTATGRTAGAALLRPDDLQVWLPIDTPGAVSRFLKQHRPTIGVLMETEVWPNLLHAARQAGLPMVLANGRLSARSLARGQRTAALLRPALHVFEQVLAQTEADAERFRAAGARAVQVVGNLKFDVAPDPVLLARGQAWRQGLRRSVVLAVSTREGEEALLLQAWSAAMQRVVRTPGADSRPASEAPLLLLVPRHPQRFEPVMSMLAASGLSSARRSHWQQQPLSDAAVADVWLGDSMGELPLYYGMADVALLGGSFAPLGGQNLIEAAACGCPVVMGPHTFNFEQAAEQAEAAGAAWRVTDFEAGVQLALQFCETPADGADALARRAAARAFAERHRGAAVAMAQQVLWLCRI